VSQWPNPNGRAPKSIATIDHPLRPDPDEIISEVPTCRHCGATTNLIANGSYLSRRWDERRQQVICRTCGRGSYLPLGMRLRRKPARAPAEQFILADDARPLCPFCSGTDIQRKGILHCGTQRWFCTKCRRRFVSRRYRRATLDRRKISHFDTPETPDAAEEASALLRLFENGECGIDEIRELIRVSESEKRCLQFLADQGMLASTNIEYMIKFRNDVLEKFNSLVNLELQALVEKIGEANFASPERV